MNIQMSGYKMLGDPFSLKNDNTGSQHGKHVFTKKLHYWVHKHLQHQSLYKMLCQIHLVWTQLFYKMTNQIPKRDTSISDMRL